MKNQEWVHPETITGPPAEGARFFRRDYINEGLWREINKGVHILFAAPRRVGKTSIMKDIVYQGKEDYLCIFENIQSINTNEQFYKRLYFLLLNQLGNITKAKKYLTKWLKTKGIEEINWEGGVKFKEKQLDYKNELLSLITKLSELNQKTVLFLDEFAEVIFRVKKKEGADSAIDILHTLREIRNKKDFSYCYFVLSGSVGLDHVVESIDRLTLINDLHSLKVGALNETEANRFIRKITKGASMQIGKKELKHINSKLKHMVPYFIQLIIEECNTILQNGTRADLTKEDIDNAFDIVVKTDKNLNDWEDRLKPPYLSIRAFRFCREILTRVAHFDEIPIQDIYNISIEHKEIDDYMNHLKMLVHDGYLIEFKENTYRFVSPLLQAWWKRQHPKFELEKKQK
jgi:hypothetical protein